MTRPQWSLARLIAVVAIVALDCGLIRLFLSICEDEQFVGLGAVGLAVSLGLIGLLLARGRLRRFAAGFVVTALLSAITWIAILFASPPGIDELYTAYVNGAMKWLPRSLTDLVSLQNVDPSGVVKPGISLSAALLVEMVDSLPLLTVALVGGLLALVFRRRERSNPAPDAIPT